MSPRILTGLIWLLICWKRPTKITLAPRKDQVPISWDSSFTDLKACYICRMCRIAEIAPPPMDVVLEIERILDAASEAGWNDKLIRGVVHACQARSHPPVWHLALPTARVWLARRALPATSRRYPFPPGLSLPPDPTGKAKEGKG